MFFFFSDGIENVGIISFLRRYDVICEQRADKNTMYLKKEKNGRLYIKPAQPHPKEKPQVLLPHQSTIP